jgi:formylmethanofuran dehydrogenase subunit E
MQDQQPSAAYEGAMTPEEIGAVNRREHEAARKRTKTRKGATLPAAEWERLSEDHRRAWVRYYEANRPKVETVRIGGVTITRPRVAKVHEEKVCVECGESKPENKFPTISGKPGVRETTCRDCKHAAVTARRTPVPV